MVLDVIFPAGIGVNRAEVRPASERLFHLDVIRAIAIIMVVLLHSSSPMMYQIAQIPAEVWNVHNLIDSAVRVCVPLFFMISGFLLLSSTSATDEKQLRDVARRVIKVIVPLVAWSIIYRCYGAFINGVPIGLSIVIDTIKAMMQSAQVYHLWFLYELIALYLLLPILRRLFQDSDKPAIYFFFLWCFLLVARFVTSQAGWSSPLSNYLNFGSAGFLVAGHLLRRHMPNPAVPAAVVAAACYIIATAITISWTETASRTAGAYVEAYHVYMTPNVVVMSISAFVLFLFFGNVISRNIGAIAKRIIASLATCSFGIYLIHVLVLERFGYNFIGTPSTSQADAVLSIAATAVVTIAISWAVIWCLRFLRITRWIVP